MLQASQPEEEGYARYYGLSPAGYYCWQYSGGVLALTSLVGLLTTTYEEEDPWVIKRLVGFLLLLLVALIAHESRPYKVNFWAHST